MNCYLHHVEIYTFSNYNLGYIYSIARPMAMLTFFYSLSSLIKLNVLALA